MSEVSEIEKYAKENFSGGICIECGCQGPQENFGYVVSHAVTCWAPEDCSPAEYGTRCPDCKASEDSIEDQGDLFIEIIGDRFEEGREYIYYDCGLNDIEEAYNPHIMIVVEETGYVEERIPLCAE